MATSEIEKLERRYAENPHGLTFAPLAEVHRKNGDVPRALELLTAGLELHPNYIPASIVLGRCHQDLGDLASAEAAFAHVLRLDDENVIALKSLADISERLERYPEAENWLRRLVAVDRSNDDAKEQLRRVEAARQGGIAETGAAAPAAEPPVAEPVEVGTPAPAPVLQMIDLTPAPAAASEVPVEAAPGPPPVEVAALVQRPEPEPEPEPTAPAEPAVAVSASSQSNEPPLPFIDGTVPDTSAPTSPAAETIPPETAVSEPAVSGDDIVQPLPGLISAEFQPPLEATGGLGVETSEEVLLEVSGNSEFSVPDASEDLKSLAARLTSPPSPRAPAEAAAPPAEERPPALNEEVPPPAPAQPERVAAEAPRRPYLARETNGQSVAAFFRAMLAARLSAEGAEPSPISGQNGSSALGYGDESLPVPPAVPAVPAVPAAEQKNEGVVSFDDFFGSEADEATPLRQGKGDSGEDDLDQFQSWLQNLKR